MKVDEPPPIQPTRPVGVERSVPPASESGGAGEDRRHGEDRRRDAQGAGPLDIAALHGIDESVLIPSVREAFESLLAEVASLREELDHSRKRLEYLEALADQDPVSAALNRRAFTRELSRAMLIVQRRGAPGSLVFLAIRNLGEINDRQGLAAGDAAVEHLAEILQSHIPEGDIVGRLGGAEFGLVLIGEAAADARARVEVLLAIIAARPLVWEGISIPLTIGWAVHGLAEDENASTALNAAERALRLGDKDGDRGEGAGDTVSGA